MRHTGVAASGARRLRRMHFSPTKWLAAAIVALTLSTGLTACGNDDLSGPELAEIDRLTERLRRLCERDAPLEFGSETAPALRTLNRMMNLVEKSPHQRWVIDPNDHDTGTTTPASRMQYVSEIFGVAAEPGDPICSRYLQGRVEQFLDDIGYPDF